MSPRDLDDICPWDLDVIDICIALESEFGSRVSDTAWALNLLLLGSSSYCVLSMLNHNHQVRRAILFERVSRSVATRG